MAASPNAAQLPIERKKLNQMMKLVTKSVELEEGDTLVFMDSGNALSVAHIQAQFKSYANFVVTSSGSESGETATTACGKQLTHRGKCTVSRRSANSNYISGNGCRIADCINSTMCQTRARSHVSWRWRRNGKKRQTGKTIRIHEIDGVYDIEIKFGDVPDDQPTACDNSICAMQKPEDFPRRGRLSATRAIRRRNYPSAL